MEVLDRIVKEFNDCSIEARVSREESFNVNFEDGKFKGAEEGERVKLEVRATKDLRSAFAWTNDLSNWRECASRARKLMLASSPLKLKPVLSKAKSVSESFISDSINDVDIQALKNKGVEVVEAVRKLGVSVPNLTVSRSLVYESFLNSELTSYERKGSEVHAELECAKGSSSSSDFRTSQGLDIDFAALGESTARLCLDSLKPKKISPGLFSVVFDFNALAQLLSILEPGILANNVIEHNSFLEGKKGVQVISPLLTISDAGMIPGGVGNNSMDAEGTRVKDKELFSKGVLNGFINDLYTSARLGDAPSGNSNGLLKRGFISVNNILVKPGSASREELLSDCVYVNNLMGTHTANTITGDFALNALNAFRYENGKRIPLRDVLISGNIFGLLGKASLVGKSVRSDSMISAPLIKFSDVQVIG